MKKNFSPGPWSLDESGWVVDREGEPVCLINAGLDYKQFSSQEKSDTHLIAAAPELYEALEIAIDELKAWVKYAEEMSMIVTSTNPAILHCKEALAKARGEV